MVFFPLLGYLSAASFVAEENKVQSIYLKVNYYIYRQYGAVLFIGPAGIGLPSSTVRKTTPPLLSVHLLIIECSI